MKIKVKIREASLMLARCIAHRIAHKDSSVLFNPFQLDSIIYSDKISVNYIGDGTNGFWRATIERAGRLHAESDSESFEHAILMTYAIHHLGETTEVDSLLYNHVHNSTGIVMLNVLKRGKLQYKKIDDLSLNEATDVLSTYYIHGKPLSSFKSPLADPEDITSFNRQVITPAGQSVIVEAKNNCISRIKAAYLTAGLSDTIAVQRHG